MSLRKAALGRILVRGSLTHGQFPRLGEARRLLTHARHSRFQDLQLARFRAARSLLKSRDIHSQIFILFLERREVLLETIISGGGDFQMRIEVLLQLVEFVFQTLDLPIEVGLGRQGTLQDKGSNQQAEPRPE